MVSPGTEHLVHAEVLTNNQEALLLFHPVADVNSCFPCYLELHEVYSPDQNIHNTRVVAFYRQVQPQVQLQSVKRITS